MPAHKGDYCDAIDKRKALVRLLVHEAGGGLAPYAAKYLRFLSRRARINKHDATDYQCSYSARAFVPFYAQRLSATSAMNAAQGIHKGIDRAAPPRPPQGRPPGAACPHLRRHSASYVLSLCSARSRVLYPT